jgi:hypothetical protein
LNPWIAVPDAAPYVLTEDRDLVERFNAKATPRTRIETDLLPEPFVGRLDAPIVLLTLNPGVADGDFALHRQPSFQERVRACYRQEATDWPYYYLDPTLDGPGARWSRRVLGPLISVAGLEVVARGVVLFDYFPYHSRAFGHHALRVPSQTYGFAAVYRALANAAAVFITRGRRIWESAIPELATHSHLFGTNSVQNIVISPRNAPGGWDHALLGLRAVAG